MELLVIRHGIAEDKDEWAEHGHDDDDRPLTKDGRRRMRNAARGLRRLVPDLPLLATSPLLRARETAAIVSAAYDGTPAGDVAEALRPEGAFADFLPWMESRADHAAAGIVGHEPHLSCLVSWLLTGRTRSFIELKKGGACLLAFDDVLGSGRARLVWSLAPGHLRRLGSA